MKVLHVVGDSAFGGGSRIILRLAQRAIEVGHDVSILATDPRFVAEIEELGIAVETIDVIRREIHPFRDFRAIQKLACFLRERSYDLVHTHTSKAGFVGRIAASRAHVPAIVHTVHGFAFHEASRRMTIAVYAIAERIAAHHCHRLVTVSRFHRSWAIDLGIAGPEKVVAIPNGISPAPTLEDDRRRVLRRDLGVGEDSVMLVSAGRLAAGKGLPELIEAVSSVRSRVTRPIALVLPGSGNLERALMSQVKRSGLDEHVIMPGFRDDAREIVAAADIVVLPSEREGLSLALLEAMSARKPIVASSIGSNCEATDGGKAALLVPPRRIDPLAAAIVRVVEDADLRTALGRRAGAVFEANYSEERMLSEYMRLYSDLDPVLADRQ